jgi:hypothetical protein
LLSFAATSLRKPGKLGKNGTGSSKLNVAEVNFPLNIARSSLPSATMPRFGDSYKIGNLRIHAAFQSSRSSNGQTNGLLPK